MGELAQGINLVNLHHCCVLKPFFEDWTPTLCLLSPVNATNINIYGFAFEILFYLVEVLYF
uniref:Uncharacterized protein n=1 Tax=Rhizophora mucronata TaxID=61149 RepID=A0A2P2M535_RHIMU